MMRSLLCSRSLDFHDNPVKIYQIGQRKVTPQPSIRPVHLTIPMARPPSTPVHLVNEHLNTKFLCFFYEAFNYFLGESLVFLHFVWLKNMYSSNSMFLLFLIMRYSPYTDITYSPTPRLRPYLCHLPVRTQFSFITVHGDVPAMHTCPIVPCTILTGSNTVTTNELLPVPSAHRRPAAHCPKTATRSQRT
jgi:hypothetical protein